MPEVRRNLGEDSTRVNGSLSLQKNAESTTNRREAAAILIQAHYRGHLGRKEHVRRLYEQFERVRANSREKTSEKSAP